MNDEQKTGESPRLGKEAKIGATVILVLLLVFAAVVVVRLSGSGPGDGLAVAADRGPGKAGQPVGDKGEKSAKTARPKPLGGNPPTVVLAKADTVRPPKTIDNDFDKWKLASDKGEPKRVEGSGPALISPPPLPPEPSKALPGSRNGRNLSGPSSDREFDGAVRSREEISSDRPGTSGYTSAGAPPPLPPYREQNRYDNSRPLSPPGPSPSDRSYADTADQFAQAAPVSRYGASEYPRHSSSSMYGGDAPPRRAAPRSFGSPPPLREDGKYEVQPLDSYWKISEKLYGTGAYFKALVEHNRGKEGNEGQLKPGELILAPTVEQLEKSYPELCPKPSRRETLRNRASTVGTRRQYRSGRTYTVAEGDTLFDIARYELGKASRWVEIYELNRHVLGEDFNYITPGTQLVLPESGRPDVLAEPPSSGYRR